MRSYLDVDGFVDSDSPKNINNDSVSPSSRVLRDGDVQWGGKSDLVDSFEKGEIRMIRSCINDGCNKNCMEKIWKMMLVRCLEFILRVNNGNVTTDDNGGYSDKHGRYRDPNGNITGNFSLAQLRSWKDYFPSDLQIWSYYGNVKEAILLHNALSRQTKDAG
ncbi:zinc finger CCCH domain-containing protein 19 [Tanacetum coccineum]